MTFRFVARCCAVGHRVTTGSVVLSRSLSLVALVAQQSARGVGQVLRRVFKVV